MQTTHDTGYRPPQIHGIPIHEAIEIGKPGLMTLRCAPNSASQVVAIMLEFNRATTVRKEVTCRYCKGARPRRNA